MSAQLLSLFGLGLNVVGSALLIWFPLQVCVLTERGEPALTLVADAGPDGDRRGKRYACLSKAGPALLAVGFVLQFVGTLKAQC